MDTLSLAAIVAALAGVTFHSSGWFCVSVAFVLVKAVVVEFFT